MATSQQMEMLWAYAFAPALQDCSYFYLCPTPSCLGGRQKADLEQMLHFCINLTLPQMNQRLFEILLPIEQLNKGILLTAVSIRKNLLRCTCQFGCSLRTQRPRISRSFKVLMRTSRFSLNL